MRVEVQMKTKQAGKDWSGNCDMFLRAMGDSTALQQHCRRHWDRPPRVRVSLGQRGTDGSEAGSAAGEPALAPTFSYIHSSKKSS